MGGAVPQVPSPGAAGAQGPPGPPGTPQYDPTNLPIPDPSALTTAQILREIGQLRELLQAQIANVDAVAAQKYRAVEVQLAFLEQQRVEQKADTKAAVDAALTAQKEAARELAIASEKAITKTETNTSELLKQLQVSFTTENKALRDINEDLKQQIGKVETRVTAVEQQKIGAGDSRTAIYALAGFVLTMLSLAGIVVAFLK